MSTIVYASTIAQIIHDMSFTRTYVAYDLSMVRRYQGKPGLAHWATMKNILLYL